jgi:hypothetical protein
MTPVTAARQYGFATRAIASLFMSVVSAPAQVQQWRRWIHGDIYSEVMGMFWRRKMWLDVDQMLSVNPSVGLMPSSFWTFYHGNYAAAQSIAIRRQADKRGDTSSLWRLLQDIARKPDLLTRETYVALLNEEQARDELMVERANRDWEKWADQTAAGSTRRSRAPMRRTWSALPRA